MISRNVDLLDMQFKLLNWLRKKMPQAQNLTIADMERSGAGFTNESFLFDLSCDENGERKTEGMLLRCEGTSYPVYPDPKVITQFRVLEQLGKTDVPIPKVYWLEEDKNILGTPFYLMGKLDGTVPSEFPPYHSFGICYDSDVKQRKKMWWQLIEGVARLHKLNWRKMDFSFLKTPADNAASLNRDLAYWENYFKWIKDSPNEPHPVLEATLGWLKKNRYEPEHMSICWGDARMPNAIFSNNGTLLGLLDWDIVHLGDPESDLAFILTLDHLLSEGIGVPRLEGLPGKEETIKRYEELTGWKVKNFFYNEVRAAFVTGLHVVKVQKNLMQLGVALPGDDPNRDNFCTQYLAKVLDLPAPGVANTDISRIEDLVATIQFHLTGLGINDWYIVCDKGTITKNNGKAENSDTTVTLPAETWARIQKGETNHFHAWTSGELQIKGDHTILHLLEGIIARLGD